jgi:hypothetical protein
MNSRTSGPPAFANLMVRDMAVSVVGMMSSSGCFGGLSCPAADELTSVGKLSAPPSRKASSRYRMMAGTSLMVVPSPSTRVGTTPARIDRPVGFRVLFARAEIDRNQRQHEPLLG